MCPLDRDLVPGHVHVHVLVLDRASRWFASGLVQVACCTSALEADGLEYAENASYWVLGKVFDLAVRIWKLVQARVAQNQKRNWGYGVVLHSVGVKVVLLV